MKTTFGNISRRTVLKGGALLGVAWASRPLVGKVQAQAPAAAIIAELVSQAPAEPEDSMWSAANPAAIAFTPQNIVLPRLQEAGASAVDVRALYDSDRIASCSYSSISIILGAGLSLN